MFTSSIHLHILSWNACGITSPAKITSLKAYIYCHHPNVIFIQEAFVGHALGTSVVIFLMFTMLGMGSSLTSTPLFSTDYSVLLMMTVPLFSSWRLSWEKERFVSATSTQPQEE